MSIVEDIKSVAKLVRQIDNIELYEKILDLQAQALELVEDNGSLRTELRRIRETDCIRDSLVFESNYYWRTAEGETRDGPFCSSCWDRDSVLVRLHHMRNAYGCPSCGRVLMKDGRMPSPQVVARYNISRSGGRRG